MNKIIIGVFVGSLRKESFCQKIANAIISYLPEQFELKLIEIGNLVMFNQDFDDNETTPAEWTVFRNEVKSLDGFLFVTPEYNRSYPPVLKNALDIASRPYGENVWSGKPGALISVSPGAIGGFGANQHLRQVMSFLNIILMQQPEAYIGNVTDSLDQNGNLSSERTKTFLQNIASSFADWIITFK